MKVTKNLGFLLLGIWLVVVGLTQILSFSIESLGTILAALGIAAGVLIIIGK